MAGLKGKKEYEKFLNGEKLSFKGAIRANCYMCNGLEEGGADCKGKSCPLYSFMPYREGRLKKVISPEKKERLLEVLKRGREIKRKSRHS